MSIAESKCYLKIILHPISTRQSDENSIMRMVKDIKNRLIIERKVRLYKHFAISFICAADAQPFGN